MDIKISMKDGKDIPETKIFHGNFALEQMYKQLTEKYFGLETAKEVLAILNKKITEEEINKFMKTEVDLKKVAETDFKTLMKKRI